LKNTIIHIGYPKTASTWFQNNVFNNINTYSYVKREDVENLFIKPYGNNFNVSKTKKFLDDNYNKNLIISDERLLGGMYSGGYNGFATTIIVNRLKQVFPDAKIIIIIRNQVDAIASAYYHYIMYGGTYNVNNFLFPKHYYIVQKLGMFSFEFYNYYNLISMYKDMFTEVNVYLYEDFKADNKSFVKKLIDENKLELDFNKLDYNLQNSRYRKGLINFKKFVNLFTKQQLIYKYYLVNLPYVYNVSIKLFEKLNKFSIFGNYVNSKKLLKQKNIEYIKEYYKESNKKIKNYNY